MRICIDVYIYIYIYNYGRRPLHAPGSTAGTDGDLYNIM